MVLSGSCILVGCCGLWVNCGIAGLLVLGLVGCALVVASVVWFWVGLWFWVVLIAFGFVLYIMLLWCLWMRCMSFGDLVVCSLVGLV